MTVHWDGVAVVAAGSASSLALAYSQRVRMWMLSRRAARQAPAVTPVTASNRAMRERRANVVFNADPGTIAFALGPYEAELAGLQRLADQLPEADDAEADHGRR